MSWKIENNHVYVDKLIIDEEDVENVKNNFIYWKLWNERLYAVQDIDKSEEIYKIELGPTP